MSQKVTLPEPWAVVRNWLTERSKETHKNKATGYMLTVGG